MTSDFSVNMNEYLPLRDVVFNTLRQAILKGELKPGERLMESHGALKAMMSGSGPTVFGIFDDREKMEAAAAVLRQSNLAKTVFATEVTKVRERHK